MGHQYVGCLAFADDLTLLAPTIQALQKLVSICEQYAAEFDVKFNDLKSQFLIFKGKGCTVRYVSIRVNDGLLSNIYSAIHLGHKISTTDKDSLVSDAICSFWKSFNLFLADFGHLNSFVKCKLFKQYCCSYYGAALWNISSKRVNDICTAWRKALRVVWEVPYMTHNYLLPIMSNCMSLKMSLERRFLKFYKRCINSDSMLIKYVAHMSVNNPFSVCRNNYLEVVHKYKLYDELSENKINFTWDQHCLSADQIACSNVITELIDVRDGFKQCNGLSTEEVNLMIQVLCID